MKDHDWAFASGKIRMIESELLPVGTLRQIAESRSLESAISILRETPYGRFMSEKGATGSLTESSLQAALREVYEDMIKCAGEALAITVFRARHDFHNLKVLARERFLEIPKEDEALSTVGSFTVRNLEQMLDGELGNIEWPANRPDLPLEQDAILKAYKTVEGMVGDESESLGPIAIALVGDSLIDGAYYGWASRMLKRLGYVDLRAFVEAEVDLLNLRMAYRSLRQRIPASLYARIVLPGGTVKPKYLESVYGDGEAGFSGLFSDTPWAKAAAVGADAIKRKAPLTSFEKLCDDSLMGVYRKARHITLGPEPILGFVLGKEWEARNIRILLAGKQASTPVAEIIERLRETYV